MSIQRYHRIHPAVVVLVAGDAHGTEDAAEAVGANALHQAGVDAVQVLVDVGRAEHLRHLALTGQAVVAEKELLHGLVATVTAVAALDVAHLIGIEPVTLALGKQVKALGIELAVVDGGIYINHLADVEAEEAAATALVGEQSVAVAGADERGYAGQRGALLGVCLAHAERGHLHEVLQRALLAGRVAVILVEVDEEAVDELALTLALGREVEVVGVEHTQLGWQEQSAEGALVHALLLAHEDGCHAVGIEGIVPALCLHHQSKHPATEVAHHRFVRSEALHQGVQAVGAVPLGERAEVVCHGMVGCDVHGLGCDVYALGPPHVVPVGLEVGHPGLVDALGDGSERCIAALHAVLRLLGEHIVAQLVLFAE